MTLSHKPMDPETHTVSKTANSTRDSSTTASSRGTDHARDAAMRETVRAEIDSMLLFQLSEGGPVPPEAIRLLDRDEHEPTSLAELVEAHMMLARVCPGTPRAIRALQEDGARGGLASFLGPTALMRRLSLVSIFFALTFCITSLSFHVNVATVTSSIYELHGVELGVKLLLILSAAGLGATFAVLFDVWNDLTAKRYDPLTESANWMRIGLGVVAGLILSEIVGGERVLAGDRGEPGSMAMPLISDPLLALIGGFSATVLHMVMTSVVEGFRRAFAPTQGLRLKEETYEALLGRLMLLGEGMTAPKSQGASLASSDSRPLPEPAVVTQVRQRLPE